MKTDAAFSILAAAEEFPDRIGLIGVDGTSFTYAQMGDRVRRLIAYLRAKGIKSGGDRVAFVGTQRLETVFLYYALFEMGVCAVPLHPRLTLVERGKLVERCTPALVMDEDWAFPDDMSPDPIAPAQVPVDGRPLAIVSSSGTTGLPKCTVLSRAAFLASARASENNFGWQDGDRWLVSLSLCYMGGLGVIVRCLEARACVAFAPGPTGADIYDGLTRHRATILSTGPIQIRELLEAGPAKKIPSYVRAILMGGMAAPPDLLELARELGLPVLATYGCTETCSQVSTQPYGRPPSADDGVGRPVLGAEIRIVDEEIQVKGPMLLTGYFPLETTPSPLTPDGWFRTGDYGRFDDRGFLHVIGRATDRIVTGGEKVDPLEVEAALTSAPGIAHALVFGVPDPKWGQLVAAALVPTGAEPSDKDLWDYLSGCLASFKRPRRLAYVRELPATNLGKLNRREAASALAEVLRPLDRGAH